MRLQKLDGYLRANILVHDYLEIDSNIVYRNLAEGLDDFDEFAQQIIARFLPDTSAR